MNMSDRLKDTLGLLADTGFPVKSVDSDFDSEIVGSKGAEVIPFVMKEVKTNVPESENSDIREDYITSRNLTHTLIEMAGSAIEGALSVAIETQHPKAFSVFNELATTMRGLSQDLLNMQKIYKEISAEKAAKQEADAAAAAANMAKGSGKVTQNFHFENMSLSDVLKMVKDQESKGGDNVTVINPEDLIDV